jgi:hypothetical protein
MLVEVEIAEAGGGVLQKGLKKYWAFSGRDSGHGAKFSPPSNQLITMVISVECT